LNEFSLEILVLLIWICFNWTKLFWFTFRVVSWQLKMRKCF